MEHCAFIEAYKNKTINVSVNRPKALRVLSQGLLSKKYQYVHFFWTSIWVLSYLAGILIMIFLKWWIGLIFLIFIPQILLAATRKSAMGFIIEYALENGEFYQYAIKENIIIIE